MSIMRDVAAGLNEVGIPPAPGNSKWSAAYLQRARQDRGPRLVIGHFKKCEPAVDGIACVTISEDFAHF